MFDDVHQLLRAAVEHHVHVYGRYELLRNDPLSVLTAPAPDPGTGQNTNPPPVSMAPPAAGSSPYDRIAASIPVGSPVLSIGTLDELEAYVRGTVLIPLDETRINPVFGVGNPEADLMVVGEAPGADEDRQGEPFVGKAGQLLTQILKAIGFERDDVYIANILKSRPPGNRDPLPDEVAAHLPILLRQITLIRPKLLLCVGRTAGNSLLGRQSSLKELRGQFHDFHGLEVMVTFHPAALLRNPEWKRPTWDDVQQLRRRYDELTST